MTVLYRVIQGGGGGGRRCVSGARVSIGLKCEQMESEVGARRVWLTCHHQDSIHLTLTAAHAHAHTAVCSISLRRLTPITPNPVVSSLHSHKCILI